MESIADYVASVASGRTSCEEKVTEELSNIDTYNDRLNAFITVFGGENGPALMCARERDSTKSSERRRGPLFGLPFSLKDSIFFGGFPTTNGSLLLKDFIPVNNAWIVDRLLDLGAVPIGKANMHEFALGPTASSAYGGPVHNPADDARISGGSSGGSVAAVAMSKGPALSVGGDTGGSVRIPAALSGVVGFKPSQGALNTEGGFPLGATLDHLGLFTKTMDDVIFSFGAVMGQAPRAASRSGGRMKVGVPKKYFIDDMDEQVSRDFWAAVEELKSAYDVVEVEADGDYARFARARTTIQLKEAAWFYRQFLVSPASRKLMHGDVLALMDRGLKVGTLAYMNATLTRLDAMRAGERLLKEVDAVVMPTCRIVAPRIEDVVGKETGWVRPTLIKNTEFFNSCGFPALSVPMHRGGRLPTGLQVVGHYGDDGVVLQIGKGLSDAIHRKG